MKIKITKGGIFGVNGEIPVGTIFDVKDEPTGWAGRYEVISGGKGSGTEPVNNDGDKKDDGKTDAKPYDAKHKGAGVYAVYKTGTDEIVRDKVTKADAEAFDKLDAEGQEKWLKDNPTPAA